MMIAQESNFRKVYPCHNRKLALCINTCFNLNICIVCIKEQQLKVMLKKSGVSLRKLRDTRIPMRFK